MSPEELQKFKDQISIFNKFVNETARKHEASNPELTNLLKTAMDKTKGQPVQRLAWLIEVLETTIYGNLKEEKGLMDMVMALTRIQHDLLSAGSEGKPNATVTLQLTADNIVHLLNGLMVLSQGLSTIRYAKQELTKEDPTHGNSESDSAANPGTRR